MNVTNQATSDRKEERRELKKNYHVFTWICICYLNLTLGTTNCGTFWGKCLH